MLKLEVGTVYTKFTGSNSIHICNFLKGYDKDTGEEILYYNEENRTFLTGLLKRVKKYLCDQNVKYEVIKKDYNPIEDVPLDILDGISLYDYQFMAVNKIMNKRRGIIDIGTGGGKTAIMYASIKYSEKVFEKENVRSIIVVPSKNLMYQTKDKAEQYGIDDVGLFGDGKRSLDKRHVVCVANSLYSGIKKQDEEVLNKLKSCTHIYFDEAKHLGTAHSWHKISEHCVDAEYRIALDATPFRDVSKFSRDEPSDVNIVGHTGDVIIFIPVSILMSEGYVTELSVFMIPVEGRKYKCYDEPEWRDVVDFCLVEDNLYNRKIVNLCSNLFWLGWKPIIVVDRLKHGEILIEMFNESGVKAVFSSGGRVIEIDEEGEKHKVKLSADELHEMFEKGCYDVLVGSGIYKEAIDIPCIDIFINAASGRSPQQSMQKLGRSVRKYEGKDLALLLDFVHKGHFFLTRQGKTRVECYKKESIKVLPTKVFPFILLEDFSNVFEKERYEIYRDGRNKYMKYTLPKSKALWYEFDKVEEVDKYKRTDSDFGMELRLKKRVRKKFFTILLNTIREDYLNSGNSNIYTDYFLK